MTDRRISPINKLSHNGCDPVLILWHFVTCTGPAVDTPPRILSVVDRTEGRISHGAT